MNPEHDLNFINARRLEREAEASQYRLARSMRRTRSSRRWPLGRLRILDALATA